MMLWILNLYASSNYKGIDTDFFSFYEVVRASRSDAELQTTTRSSGRRREEREKKRKKFSLQVVVQSSK